jgi:hypothetical protein
MNTSASRGAILIIAAVIVGAIVLGKGFDDDGVGQVVSADGSTESDESEAEPEVTPADDAATTPDTDEPPLTQPARNPADVRALVANASQINGAAGLATDKLIARNYATLTPTNSDELLTATVIYYEETYEADAQLVASILSARPDQIEPMPATDPGGVDRRGANILVMLGADQVAQPGEPEG